MFCVSVEYLYSMCVVVQYKGTHAKISFVFNHMANMMVKKNSERYARLAYIYSRFSIEFNVAFE